MLMEKMQITILQKFCPTAVAVKKFFNQNKSENANECTR
jgi:hypothetical protein